MHHDRSAAGAVRETTSAFDAATASSAEYRELLFSVVYNLLRTVSDTEDVLRDTWLARVAGGREEVGSARADLVRIAVNEALSRLPPALPAQGAGGRHRAVPGCGGAAVYGRAGRGPQ